MIRNFRAILDKIEASEGPGVVVTIGTGKKHFSTGFDMPTWIQEPETYYPSQEEFKVLMDRLMNFQLPTLCVFNGNAMAGGLFMGACHDFRLMNAAKRRLCLTELRFGGPLSKCLMVVLQARFKPMVVTKLHTAVMIESQEALKDRIVDDTYNGSVEELDQKIKAFAKRYATLGAQRFAIKVNKSHQFEKQLAIMRNHFWNDIQMAAIGKPEDLRQRFTDYINEATKGSKKGKPKL